MDRIFHLVLLGLLLGCSAELTPAADAPAPDAGLEDARAGAGGSGGALGDQDAGALDAWDAEKPLDDGATSLVPFEPRDAGADAGDVQSPPDAGPDACTRNACGGCAELGCPDGWTGVCEKGAPCTPCPEGCYQLSLPGAMPKFNCSGTDALVCNQCVCG